MTYRLRVSAPGREPVAGAICHLPRTKEALAMLERYMSKLAGAAPRSQPGRSSRSRSSESNSFFALRRRWHGDRAMRSPQFNTSSDPCGTACTLPPIHVEAEKPPTTWSGWGGRDVCDPYDPYDFACDDPSQYDYGGGWEPEYQDPYAEAPCNTSDPVINDDAVEAGFTALWEASNPNAPMSSRLEKGGWIIKTANGYKVEPFPDTWTLGACGIDAPASTTPPSGAVAWVHTHPYAAKEVLTSCPADNIVVGGMAVQVHTTYMNDPSSHDGDASSAWNLPGYVIDKDKITQFAGNPTSPYHYDITGRVDRCGY